MTHSRTVENTNLGWKNPKPDGKRGARHGKGRDGQVDVYVTNLGANLYGYASTDPGQKGRKRFAYLVLDNDYVGFPTGPVKSMQVTVAHEYNHILQFNYDVAEDLWLFEDTATWAEEQVYPEINDYLNYLPALAGKPEKPMTGSRHQDLRRGRLEPLAERHLREGRRPQDLAGLAEATKLRRRLLRQGDQEGRRPRVRA